MKKLILGSLILSLTVVVVIATRPTQTVSLPSRPTSTPTPSHSSTPAQRLQTNNS